MAVQQAVRNCSDIPLLRVKHTIELVRLQRNLAAEVEKKTQENKSLSIHVVQTLAEAIDAKDRIGGYHKFPHRAETDLLDRVSVLCDELSRRRTALDAALEKTTAISSLADRALAYRAIAIGEMARVRETSDALEDIVSKSAWPYPSYGNLLYRV